MRNLLFIVLSLFLLTGCVTEKKAKQYAYANKEKLAEWCADCFPVKEQTVKIDTVTLLDTFTTIDSIPVIVTVDCPDGTQIQKECPPQLYTKQTVTQLINSEIKVRDRAFERVLSDSLNRASERHKRELESKEDVVKQKDIEKAKMQVKIDALETQNEKQSKAIKKLKSVLIGILGIALIRLFFKYYKPFK